MSAGSYEGAVAFFDTSRKSYERKRYNEETNNHLETRRCLEALDISMNEFDKLCVIHVTGTKGKSSTVTMVESMLRNLNLRTGLLSFHVFKWNERIRINGEEISDEMLAKYYWDVRDQLREKYKSEPLPYFVQLTVMAYKIFLDENVDVAIIECHIGGENCVTNCIKNVKTVGLTLISLEHTDVLGDTIEEIVCQKSGIMKHKSNVFTTKQNYKYDETLQKRAREKEANLFYVPENSEYHCNDESVWNEIRSNPAIDLNLSLAIQLAFDWIKRHQHKIPNKNLVAQIVNDSNYVPDELLIGLHTSKLTGHCEVIKYQNKTFFFDSAHTIESIDVASKWFANVTNESDRLKLLIFNITEPLQRNGLAFLDTIHSSNQFDFALFPRIISSCSVDCCPFDNVDKTGDYANHWNVLCGSGLHKSSETFNSMVELLEFLDVTYKGKELDILGVGAAYIMAELLKCIRS